MIARKELYKLFNLEVLTGETLDRVNEIADKINSASKLLKTCYGKDGVNTLNEAKNIFYSIADEHPEALYDFDEASIEFEDIYRSYIEKYSKDFHPLCMNMRMQELLSELKDIKRKL